MAFEEGKISVAIKAEPGTLGSLLLLLQEQVPAMPRRCGGVGLYFHLVTVKEIVGFLYGAENNHEQYENLVW